MDRSKSRSCSRRPASILKRPKPGMFKYVKMVETALKAMNCPRGASQQTILKYIVGHYDLNTSDKVVNARLTYALRAALSRGILVKGKTSGYKLNSGEERARSASVKRVHVREPAGKRGRSKSKSASYRKQSQKSSASKCRKPISSRKVARSSSKSRSAARKPATKKRTVGKPKRKLSKGGIRKRSSKVTARSRR